jgi:hypothetical protein
MSLFKTKNNIISVLNVFDSLTVNGIEVGSTLNHLKNKDDIFQDYVNSDTTATANLTSSLSGVANLTQANTFSNTNTFSNPVTLDYTPTNTTHAVSSSMAKYINYKREQYKPKPLLN